MNAYQTLLPYRKADDTSPIFNFDRAWADSIKTIRESSQPSFESQSPSLYPLSSSSGMAYSVDCMAFSMDCMVPQTSPTYATQLAGFLPGPWPPSSSTVHISSYEDPWATAVAPQRQLYDGNSSSPHETSLSLSIPSSSSSSLQSPSSSRGSKRSSAEISSPLGFTPAKRRRTTQPPPQTNLFYLEDTAEDDEAAGHEGSWEIVQGAWEVSAPMSDMPPQSPRNAPVIRVREMPKLQEPVPRMPKLVWERLQQAC